MHECHQCGFSTAMLSQPDGDCPRCSATLFGRVIARPHPDTLASARRNSLQLSPV